jgi:hypothetical protein
MNLTDRMEFGKMKQKFANGKNLTDTDICLMMAWIDNLIREVQFHKEEYSLIIGKSRTGGKLQNSSLYGKMGDMKSK